jgi:hypothetical protein
MAFSIRLSSARPIARAFPSAGCAAGSTSSSSGTPFSKPKGARAATESSATIARSTLSSSAIVTISAEAESSTCRTVRARAATSARRRSAAGPSGRVSEPRGQHRDRRAQRVRCLGRAPPLALQRLGEAFQRRAGGRGQVRDLGRCAFGRPGRHRRAGPHGARPARGACERRQAAPDHPGIGREQDQHRRHQRDQRMAGEFAQERPAHQPRRVGCRDEDQPKIALGRADAV